MQNRMKLAKLLGLAAVAGALSLCGQAQAQLFTAGGTLGAYTVAGSADFTVFSDHIEIILKNTSAIPVADNPQVLTGLFFDVAGTPVLGATAADRQIALNGSSGFVRVNNTGNLADEWGFKQPVSGQPAGAGSYGIAASGLNPIFGSHDTFSGNQNSLGGTDYGLVGVLSGSPAGGLQDNLIKDSVIIDLYKKTGDPDLNPQVNTISHVWLQWGSSTSGEPGFGGVPPSGGQVPEPGSLAMCAGVIVPVLGLIRRKRA